VAAAEEGAMIVDTSTRLATTRVTTHVVRVRSAWFLLSVLMAVAFVVRMIAALAHDTPRLFPDEYIYAELSRNLAQGSATIRGQPATFPALLEPLLAAPLWAAGGVELGYRLVQGMHAFAAALTALPVYLLARRLSIPPARALLCAAIALALPAAVFSAYITADAVALPLALAAITAAVFALERPTAKSQIAFLALAALASFARVQYVILFAAFVVAALVVAGWSVPRLMRQYGVTLAGIAVPAVAVLTTGPTRVLGYYRGILDFGLEPGTLLHWTAVDAMMVGYAGGVVLVPAAIVAVGAAVVRPRTPAERAAGAMTAAVALLLLTEAVLYAANGSERFQERYLLALLPIVPVFFCLAARRLDSKLFRTLIAGVAAGILLLAATVPLSGYLIGGGKQDSPTLQAFHELQQMVGVGNSALIVSLAAGALAIVAALAAFRPALMVPALATALAVSAVISFFSVRYDADVNNRAMRTYSASGNSRWVDDAELGSVSVLETPWSDRAQISHQLFWNRSLTRILRLPFDTEEVDAFGSVPTRVTDDGRLVAAGRTVSEPLLVQEYASWALLDGATLVRRTVSTSLWKPSGTPRLKLLLAGRYLDGWLGAQNRLTVWPGGSTSRAGVLSLTFTLPPNAPASTLDLTAPGVSRAVRLGPGASRTVRIDVNTRRPWTLVVRSRAPFSLSDGRFAIAQLSPPAFIGAEAKTS
jgi:hypothetical protein